MIRKIQSIKLNNRQQRILHYFVLKREISSSSLVHKELADGGESVSLVTVKRDLSAMAQLGVLRASGAGRSVSYEISPLGRMLLPVDVHQYCSIEPDQRYGLRGFNFDLLPSVPADVFTVEEFESLERASRTYAKKTANLPPAIRKKELERLIIELSWKSSRIEGNTYTLLDTEKLLLENKKAPGKTKEETQMILNHKEAFQYIYKHREQFKTITVKNLEELHSILVKKLGVGLGFRKKPVGVLGSIYQPLDNAYQIAEAVKELSRAVSRASNPYMEALLALLFIGYIQPFEDGNKRTSRLMANALLLSHGLSPLSYRSVVEENYREAMLAFYELNSAMPFKKIFIEQYIFATENYSVK